MDQSLSLPSGYTARDIRADDVVALAELVAGIRRRTRPGGGHPDVDATRAEAIGIGSWTRRQRIVVDDTGAIRAWAGVHDRAAGRADLVLHIDRDAPAADELAQSLLDWQEATAIAIAHSRDQSSVRLEILVDAGDDTMQGWLSAHGHAKARRWFNMSRPVVPGEHLTYREGVEVRRVRTHDLGDGTTMPYAEDLQAIHRVLERSFADHFNSYRESFGEFVQRLREDPGHRWDHWWLAQVHDDGKEWTAGGLVSTILPPDAEGVDGSYIDYIGVDRRARGRGVAKALIATVINDAAERGRNRVGLEVDADSPTGADGLYTSLGWSTRYVTESWHKDIRLSDY